MARQRRRTGCASLVFLAILAVVAGIAVAVWRGAGPLPDPEACSATVNGHDVTLAPDQARNATLIAAVAVERGLPARAVSIALATAYQESKIRNLAHGDRDSIGIFQQRPSQGWGTIAQIRNEHYSINAFYDALEKVDGYQTMRITEAAQKVQRSGFPEAYQDHAEDARALASALTGYSPAGSPVSWARRRSRAARRGSRRWPAGVRRPRRRRVRGPVRTWRSRSSRTGTATGSAGRWRRTLVAHAGNLNIAEGMRFDGLTLAVRPRPSEDGWGHLETPPTTTVTVTVS